MTNSSDVRKSVARRAAVNPNRSINQTPRPYIEFQDGLTMEKAATNMRDRLLIKLLLYTGIRISEALALTVDDINFKGCTITIRHLKACLRFSCPNCGVRLSKTAAFCPGCGSQVSEATASQREKRRLRTIPLDQGTIDLLKTYIERGGAVDKDGKKFVFNINRHRAWQVVKLCAERAGLPQIFNPRTGKFHHVSPHRLRDCFSVNAVKKSDSVDTIRMLQEHLGHQSISTTMGYRKVAGEELKTWYQKLWEKENGH